MVILFRLITLISLVYASTFIYAKEPILVTLRATFLEIKRPSERLGDELYFSIVKYSNRAKPIVLRIPDFPISWSSNNLKNRKTFILWSKHVELGEEIRLIISLMEQDAPPWNSNDHLGSVELIINNKDDIIKPQWKKSKFIDQAELIQVGNAGWSEFLVKDKGAEYHIKLSVEQER